MSDSDQRTQAMPCRWAHRTRTARVGAWAGGRAWCAQIHWSRRESSEAPTKVWMSVDTSGRPVPLGRWPVPLGYEPVPLGRWPVPLGCGPVPLGRWPTNHVAVNCSIPRWVATGPPMLHYALPLLHHCPFLRCKTVWIHVAATSASWRLAVRAASRIGSSRAGSRRGASRSRRSNSSSNRWERSPAPHG